MEPRAEGWGPGPNYMVHQPLARTMDTGGPQNWHSRPGRTLPHHSPDSKHAVLPPPTGLGSSWHSTLKLYTGVLGLSCPVRKAQQRALRDARTSPGSSARLTPHTRTHLRHTHAHTPAQEHLHTHLSRHTHALLTLTHIYSHSGTFTRTQICLPSTHAAHSYTSAHSHGHASTAYMAHYLHANMYTRLFIQHTLMHSHIHIYMHVSIWQCRLSPHKNMQVIPVHPWSRI